LHLRGKCIYLLITTFGTVGIPCAQISSRVYYM
jgi:hypothetical protein